VTRGTLIGQLFQAHTLVVAAACSLLALATMTSSAYLLRDHQDQTLEALAIEVANGIEAEAKEEHVTTVAGAAEYFLESGLEGFRFELVAKDGTLAASDGKLARWSFDGYDVTVDARAGAPRPRAEFGDEGHFRACARWCGPDYVIRIITTDVLYHPEVRRFGGALLAALPVATLIGAFLGRALFARRLRPLARLEAAAAAASTADPEVTLKVDASAREIATLRDAFNGLLARLGDALARERQFSQEASHELRTPLAALRGRIERLTTEERLTPAQADHVAAALREVDALASLVDALLLLARSESAPLPATPVNLCDLARSIGGRHGAIVEAPDEILVRGSEELLERAIANLVENARKFGGPKSTIRVRVNGNGSNAAVTVADDGPGIPAADRDHVFDRFYRGRDSRVGTEGVGLGLPVARAIAIRHRGTIRYAPGELGGAEFKIVLPLLEAQS
jgi:signal transduction histidine kinase